jgi:putative DNA primase/helicase
MSGDTLTVLTSSGIYATKRIRRTKAGEIKNRSYGNAAHFRVEITPVDDFAGLCTVLTELAGHSYSFVIRGTPLPHTNLAHTRRLLHPDRKTKEPATFEAAPRHWFASDIDHLAAPPLTDPVTDPDGCIEYLIGKLPPELHDASFWWQFTSSQSLPGSEDTLSARLWTWSKVPLTDAELTRWAVAANRNGKVIDPSLYRAVQAHYIASPIFEGGMTDSLPRRYGVRQGLEDEVVLVIPPPDPKNAEVVSRRGYEPGRGVQAYLAEIGGGRGFRAPILSAIASFIAINGGKADCTNLKKAICKAIDDADAGGRDAEQLDRYKSDQHLDELIEWVRDHHGDQPPKGFVDDPPPGFDDPPPADPVMIPAPPAAAGLPLIQVISGLRHRAADQGLAVLAAAGVAFYQRNRSLVRVCPIKAKAADGTIIRVPGIVRVSPALLGRVLGQSAYWEKVPEGKGQPWRIDPPGAVVEQILDLVEQWPFEPIAGVVTCPTLRPDGSLLDREGYDPATGLVLYQTIALPPIGETFEDAKAAVRLLDGLLEGFPFANEPSRAVALSKIVTPLLRGAFPVAPLHHTSAPEAGSGKSYLDDIAAGVATGERCAVIAVSPNAEETEKRLIGAALAGHPIITLDNVRTILEGDFLCQVTERPLLQLRPLGTSDEIRIANTFTVFANGNNLVVADDLVRRGIRCSLDANDETPEKRTFGSNPLALALGDRSAYVAAGLTIGRAYIAARRPMRPAPLPSYEGWSDLVRAALVWLGYADPVATMDDIRGADPVRQDRAAVFTAWREELKIGQEYFAAEIVELAEPRYSYGGKLIRPKLRAALLAVAEKRGRGDEIDPRRLGIWLKKNEDTIVGAFKLTADRRDPSRPRWLLRPL